MNRIILLPVIALMTLLASGPAAYAQLSVEQQQRANGLYQEVRCPVCSGQSVGGSDVTIARGIRDYIDTRITAGDTNEQIKASLAERYGDAILFEPAVTPSTLPLWLLPWTVLLAFGGGLWFLTRRKTKTS